MKNEERRIKNWHCPLTTEFCRNGIIGEHIQVIFKHRGWSRWLLLSVVALSMGEDKARGQNAPTAPPWNDLLKSELVVVGQYKSHKDGVMSLQVVDVPRGKTCKPGDVLPVKLAQSIGFKFQISENGNFVERFKSSNEVGRPSHNSWW